MHDDDYLLISANEVVVVVEVKSETVSSLIETIRSKHYISSWRLLGLTTVLDERDGLELFDGSRCCVLLSPVEGIILLRHLQTEDGIAKEDTNGNQCTKHGEST